MNFSYTKDLKETKWLNPLKTDKMAIYGFPWIKEDKVYRRLPISSFAEIEEMNPKVNHLATNTAGGQLHFYTNSSKLIVHAKVTEKVHLANMAPIAQIGFDCYVGDSYDDLLFYNATKFDLDKDEYIFPLFENISGYKLVVLNFPIYGGISNLELGFSIGSEIRPATEFSQTEKIAIYGTSITQGGCASRPGLAFVNRLSRLLKCEFLNFGFSGNGFGERKMAEIIASLSGIKMFILDYEANAGANGKLEATLEEFIKVLRKNHAKVPIVVVSRIKYLFDELTLDSKKRRDNLRNFQLNIVKKYNSLGDNQVFFIDGSELLGEDYHEFTIDSVHPNDLGFWKMSDYLYLEIKRILNLNKN